MFEEGHASDDARLATSREGVQLKLGRDEGCGELGIGGGTGTSAPDLGRNVVKLLAVLIGNDGAARGSGIGRNLGNYVRAEMARRWVLKQEPTTTPPSYMHPTMVVPVLVALGKGTPRACSAALRL